MVGWPVAVAFAAIAGNALPGSRSQSTYKDNPIASTGIMWN